MKKLFNSENHLTELGFSYYLEKKDDPSFSEVSEHLKSCSKCQSEFNLWNDFLEENELRTKPKTRYSMYSLAASILIIVCSMFYVYKIDAIDYSINERLEPMVGQMFRSNTFELHSPKAEEINIQFPITFSWSYQTNEKIYLIVLSNKNTEIMRSETVDNKIEIKDLDSGLYYWKLETEDDLLFLGKFIVK